MKNTIKNQEQQKEKGGKMKTGTRERTLASILRPTWLAFPVKGIDGYGGEADGSQVVFLGILSVPGRAAAKKITIGKAIGIHWARYSARRGWQVSLAHWDDRDEEDCFVDLGDSGARWDS